MCVCVCEGLCKRDEKCERDIDRRMDGRNEVNGALHSFMNNRKVFEKTLEVSTSSVFSFIRMCTSVHIRINGCGKEQWK